jgi:hypothetical protein
MASATSDRMENDLLELNLRAGIACPLLFLLFIVLNWLSRNLGFVSPKRSS